MVIVISPELDHLAERQAEARIHPSLIARLQPWLTLDDLNNQRASLLLKDSFSKLLETELNNSGTTIAPANVAILLGIDQDPANLEPVVTRLRSLLAAYSTEVQPFHWIGLFHGPATDGAAAASLYSTVLDSLSLLGRRNPSGTCLDPAERDWLTLRLIRWLQTVESAAETTQSYIEWIHRGAAASGLFSSSAVAEVALGIEYLTEVAALHLSGRRLDVTLLSQPEPNRLDGYVAGFLAHASMGSAGTLDAALLAAARPHLADPLSPLPARGATEDDDFAALLVAAGESLESTAAANDKLLRERFLPLWVAEWTILFDQLLADAVNHQTGGLRLALDLTTRLETHIQQLTETPRPPPALPRPLKPPCAPADCSRSHPWLPP